MTPEFSSTPSMDSMPTALPGAVGTGGNRIDHYEILRKLGGGGFGVVYLARDTVSGMDVALKTLHPLLKRNADEMEVLREKFALASRLSHPNIATALVLHPCQRIEFRNETIRRELRLSPGDPVMVMRYAPGVTLGKWRRQFPGGVAPLRLAVEVARQVAAALDYAHGERIVHRDVKPSNIMVETPEESAAAGGASRPGEPPRKTVRRDDSSHPLLRVRLLDFGLAAEIRSSMSRVSSEPGDTSGTRPYMAPEQWLGSKQDGRTDQYALACVVYELLSGEPPFAGVFETGDPAIMRSAVTSGNPQALENVPPCVNEAFSRALAKSRSVRYPTCSAFVAALSGRFRDPGSPRGTIESGMAGITGFRCGTPGESDLSANEPNPKPARGKALRTGIILGLSSLASIAAAFAFFRIPAGGRRFSREAVAETARDAEAREMESRASELEKHREFVKLVFMETSGYSSWDDASSAEKRAEIESAAKYLDGCGFTPEEIEEARKVRARTEKARNWMVSNAPAHRAAAEAKKADAEAAKKRAARLDGAKDAAKDAVTTVSGIGEWHDGEWTRRKRDFDEAWQAIQTSSPDEQGLGRAESALETLRATANWLVNADRAAKNAVSEIETLLKTASERKRVLDSMPWSDEAWNTHATTANEAFGQLAACDAPGHLYNARAAASTFDVAAGWMEMRLDSRKELESAEKESESVRASRKPELSDGELEKQWKNSEKAFSLAWERKSSGQYELAAKSIREGSGIRGKVLRALDAAKHLDIAVKCRANGDWKGMEKESFLALEIDPENERAQKIADEAEAIRATTVFFSRNDTSASDTTVPEVPDVTAAGGRLRH